MGNDIRLELPDTLFMKHRLYQEGPLVFRLDEKFRHSLLAPFPRAIEPRLPKPSTLALWEAAALADYYSKLTALLPGRLQADQLIGVVERLTMLARQNPDGAVAAILLCQWENYVAHHAINVALLASLMADRLNLDAAIHRLLVLAALTMNLGAIALHNEMAHQEGPPCTMQRQLIDMHPIISSALLREIGFEDERLHLVVLTHHERHDGHGYPFKLKAHEIDQVAHLLHLLDVAIAKLMPRSYRQRLPAKKALAQLYTNAGEPFEPCYFMQLVKVLGLYPSGSFVSLDSGESALVVMQTARAHAPRVATLKGRYALFDTATRDRRIARSIHMPVEARHLSWFAPFWGLN
ncbi:HD-GYP domain-containing protein [Pseudogulbenkiania sp. MAI-1]|uniref:HD-GYP domain-containing protein n=1 Tax=Pseudogulbenkiania sp. MAI-1 TaxID=990370 RepID=UPI00045E97BE|nr:HD domain-containing phosphohydrolase [Pseudogulbenkiania sp. MAI-1]